MADRVIINTEVFKWARLELNLSIEDIASKMSKSEEEIVLWESGELQPTYKQLEKLAYKIFNIPIATFFLSEVPEDVSVKKDFRTLANDVIAGISYETRLSIKRANYLMSVLKELFDTNKSDSLIFRDFQVSLNNEVESIASSIRDYLQIDAQTQFNFSNSYQAFNYYRDRIEEKGVYIFQFKLEGDRAFCLYDEVFPIIVVNSGDSINSRIFSVFHELCHILIQESNIFIDKYLNSYQEREAEIFCNRVAAEVLLPNKVFMDFFFDRASGKWSEEFVKQAARSYSVSKEVILRRLLDNKIVSQRDYQELKAKWDEEFRNRKSSGGSYYRNIVSSLGRKFIGEVLSLYRIGKINDTSANNFLGVKLGNFGKLETELYS